jgi:hypothetical protein
MTIPQKWVDDMHLVECDVQPGDSYHAVIPYADHCRAVKDAVKQERERCAELAEDHDCGSCPDICPCRSKIAYAIRQEPVAAPQKEE